MLTNAEAIKQLTTLSMLAQTAEEIGGSYIEVKNPELITWITAEEIDSVDGFDRFHVTDRGASDPLVSLTRGEIEVMLYSE